MVDDLYRLPWDDDDTSTELPENGASDPEAITRNADTNTEAANGISGLRPLVALSLDDFLKAPTVPRDIEWADLIMIDNLATLSRHGKENEIESWHPMQEWLLSLRRRRKSVLLVHHSNKGGAQRGTSSREDILDTVISLNHPADYEPRQGARFIVAFEKTRGRLGADADPFEASMEVQDGAARWTARNIEDTLANEVAELRAEGKSYREIGSVLGISKSTAERAFRRHQEMGAR